MSLRGFTLIEISIVVLVIGVLTLISIRIIDIRNASIIQKDVLKINKISMVLNTMSMLNNDISYLTELNRNNRPSSLQPTDFIIESVYKGKLGLNNDQNNEYLITRCDYFDPARVNGYNVGSGVYICITTNTALKMICNIEKLLDDSSLIKGRGMYNAEAPYKINDYTNCETVGLELHKYAYQIL